jgi:hypothetical protein
LHQGSPVAGARTGVKGVGASNRYLERAGRRRGAGGAGVGAKSLAASGTVAAGGHVVAGEAETGCRAIGEGASA